MEARLFHHLIRLPLDYFQKRQLGDVLQRFRALEPIKQLISNGGIAAILDGVMALFTGALMLVYSVNLGLLVISVFFLYAMIRIVARSISRALAADALVADAREQSRFLETIRAIQTIKVSGGEVNRESSWRNLYAAKLNSNIKIGNLNIAYQGLNSLLVGLSDVVVLWIAARQAISGDLTIGMIAAFMTYKSQFMGRMTAFLDKAIEFLMLDVQLDRVGDIALTEREPQGEARLLDRTLLVGDVDVNGLRYRYASTEPEIIKGLTFNIRPGEFVAITGASGEGKSTLLKLLIGLFQPTGGEIHIDGIHLRSLDISVFRRQLGVVMQEDQLLAGTIAENIALFDETIDMEKVRFCAQQADISDEIMAFPMQYNSLVGDMGTTLSSGQKQRVLIARALYRNPRFLVMDEGTAHLDKETEERITRMLRDLKITRIIVAHSQAAIRAADRVFELRSGYLHELGRSASNIEEKNLAS